MIKVLHVLSSVGTTGGVQGMLWNYYKHIDENDVRFDFVSLTRELTGFEKNFTNRCSKIYFATPMREGVFKNIRDIDRAMKSDKYDIVHCHQDFLGYIAMFLAWKNRIPKRIIHTHKAKLKESKKQRIRHKIFGAITAFFATDIWGCGKDALLWTFGGKKCEKKNGTVINNAIEVENYIFDSTLRNKVRNELGIPDDCKVIGNVARFTPQKNLGFLVDIFDEIIKKDPSYRLMMVGTGELFDDVMGKISKKGLSDKVLALGSRTDVNELMQAMDIFLLPSVWEGLGIVLVEAQGSNLPCVASSGVPFEVNLTGDVKYISLDTQAKVWAEEISKLHIPERKDNTDIITQKGYNIKKEAENLIKLYHGLVEKDNVKNS